MHRSVTTPRHRWLGRLLCALLLSTSLPLAGGAFERALADTVADKRAEAERLARDLEIQGERVSVLAEQLNQARMKADRLSHDVTAAEGELAAADREVGAVRARLRDRAVASYVRGTELPMEQMLVSGSANDVAVRAIYVATVAGQEQVVVESLDEAQERRRARQAELKAAQREAKALLADVEAQRRAASQAASARQASLDRVKGELGALVEAETARRAEEQAKRVQAELAARAERDARSAREAAERGALAAAARAAAEASAARRAEEASRRATSTTRAALAVPALAPAPKAPDPDGEPAPTSTRPPAPGAATAVAEAKRQLGKPYEWGGSGPGSFDCSGLTSWAWRAGGRSLPHSSAAQYNATIRVAVADLQPGDLIFYGTPIHHVGIYAGDGQMVEASETGTPVRTASIYRRDLVGAGRVG